MIRGQWQVPSSPYLFEGLNDDVVGNIMDNLSGWDQLSVKRVSRATRDRLHALPFLEMNWRPLLRKLNKIADEKPKNRIRQALDIALGRHARSRQLALHRYGLDPAVLNGNDKLARAMHALERDAEHATFLRCVTLSGVSTGPELLGTSRAQLSGLDTACAYLQMRCPKMENLSLIFRPGDPVRLSPSLSEMSSLVALVLVHWTIPPAAEKSAGLPSPDDGRVGSAHAQEMRSYSPLSPPLPGLRCLVLLGRQININEVNRLLPYLPRLRRLAIDFWTYQPLFALRLSELSELRCLEIPNLPLHANVSTFTLPASLERLDLSYLADDPDVDFGSLMPKSLRELTIECIDINFFPAAIYTLSQLTFLGFGGRSFALTPERVSLPSLKTLAIGNCEVKNEMCTDVHLLVDQLCQLRSLFLVGLTRLKTATQNPQRHASLENITTYNIPSLAEGDLKLLAACPNAEIIEQTTASGLKRQLDDEHPDVQRRIYAP